MPAMWSPARYAVAVCSKRVAGPRHCCKRLMHRSTVVRCLYASRSKAGERAIALSLRCSRSVPGLSGEDESRGTAVAVGGQVDLRGRPATGPADGVVSRLVGRRPFAAIPGRMLVSAHDRGVH